MPYSSRVSGTAYFLTELKFKVLNIFILIMYNSMLLLNAADNDKASFHAVEPLLESSRVVEVEARHFSLCLIHKTGDHDVLSFDVRRARKC